MADLENKPENSAVKEKGGGIVGFLVESYKGIVSVVAWVLLLIGAGVGAASFGFVGILIGALAVFILEVLILPPLIILFYIHTELQDIKAIMKK